MINKNNHIKKGMLLAFITSIISGVSIFYAKVAVTKIDPLILTTARNFYVGVLFIFFFIFNNRLGQIRKLNRNQLFQLILIGLIGGGIPFYLFFSGLQSIGAQTGNLLHKTLFIWITILGVIFLKEKLNLSYLISYILVFAGTFFFASFKFAFGKGEMLVLTATILWSVENILAKKTLKNVASELVGLFRMGIGSLVLLALVIVSEKQNLIFSLNTNQLTTIAVGGTILCFYVYFWYKALKYAPVGLVALLLTFSVVVGSILNGGFVGAKIPPQEIYSSLFIGSGVFLVYFRLLYQSIVNRSG